MTDISLRSLRNTRLHELYDRLICADSENYDGLF
jgi:hypothetical protein